MTGKRVTGLVGAGGVSLSFLARMPALLGDLGPVKAASFRVARRIANSLHAGYAVGDYAALERSYLIWLAVPDAMLDDVARDLAAQTPLEGKMVVLCGSTLDSQSVPINRARVASLNVIVESGERRFVAEGHPDVMRELRRLAAAEKRKLIEIRPASKALYFAGIHFAAFLVLPWIAAAVESLRAAGFSRSEATRVVEAMGTRSLRAYRKAGLKAWNPGTAAALRRAIERDLETIRSVEPRLAALHVAGVDPARRYFER